MSQVIDQENEVQSGSKIELQVEEAVVKSGVVSEDIQETTEVVPEPEENKLDSSEKKTFESALKVSDKDPVSENSQEIVLEPVNIKDEPKSITVEDFSENVNHAEEIAPVKSQHTQEVKDTPGKLNIKQMEARLSQISAKQSMTFAGSNEIKRIQTGEFGLRLPSPNEGQSPQRQLPSVDLPDVKLTGEKKSKGFLGMGKKQHVIKPEEVVFEDEEGKSVNECDTFQKFIQKGTDFPFEVISQWAPDFEGQVLKLTRGLVDGRQLKATKWSTYFAQISQGFAFLFPTVPLKKKPPACIGILDLRGMMVQERTTKNEQAVISLFNDAGFQVFFHSEQQSTLLSALQKNTSESPDSYPPKELEPFFPRKEKKATPTGGKKSSLMAVMKKEEEQKKQLQVEAEKREELRKQMDEERKAAKNKQASKVFDVSLEEMTIAKEDGVPKFLQQCLFFIEQHGKDVVGIYRLSGNSDEIKQIKQYLEDYDMFPEASDPLISDVNNLTGIVKLFLRSLTIPIVPFDKYNDMIALLKQDHSPALRELIHSFPQEHFAVFKLLIAHLSKMSAYHDVTKMNAANFGIVIGPNVLRPKEESMETAMHSSYQTLLIERLVAHFDDIFY